jgi:TPR repeat protein
LAFASPHHSQALERFTGEVQSSSANEKIVFSHHEMASSSSFINKSIPLATLLKWYKIRDTFFGHNFVSQNIRLALELASSCEHPDALWLTEAFAGKNVRTVEGAKRFFSALGQEDARAVCFDRRDLTSLHRSAERGFTFAQALMARTTRGEERFNFAQLAAAQGERDGGYLLGACLSESEGCEKDLDKAKENFLLASELGHVSAMVELGWLLYESDPQRWRWWGRAAALGDCWWFLSNFAEQVELFNSGSGSGAVVFAIGQALHGHVNEEAKIIFEKEDEVEALIDPAKQAIVFYEAQIKATKNAMLAWTQVGIKLKVVKDVRKLIAKLMWDSREVALYDVPKLEEQKEQKSQPSTRLSRAQKRARK